MMSSVIDWDGGVPHILRLLGRCLRRKNNSTCLCWAEVWDPDVSSRLVTYAILALVPSLLEFLVGWTV